MSSANEPPDGGGGVDADMFIEDSQPVAPVKRKASDCPTSPSPKKRDPVGASIQTTYVHPKFQNEHILYKDGSGPFIVIVKKKGDPRTHIQIDHLKFGMLLHKNKIGGIVSGGILKKGPNKISVEFKSAMEANNFFESDLLKNNNFETLIPNFNISRMGVVRNVPKEWSLEDLVMGMEGGEVIQARRLSKKSIGPDGATTWIPTTTVVLTFLGQHLPERVFCYHVSLPVFPYQLPIIQCRVCCRFGHTAKICRSKPRCSSCGGPHSGRECDNQSSISCVSCGSSRHPATSPDCPEFVRQRNIKVVMAEKNITFFEAEKFFPPIFKKSYVDISKNSASPKSSSHHQTSADPPSPRKLSYRETIFMTPRRRPPLGKSYDRLAHSSIISEPTSDLPNGHAYPESPTPKMSPNDNLIEVLTVTLINMISKFSDALPENIISLLKEFLQKIILNNNGWEGNPTMEL